MPLFNRVLTEQIHALSKQYPVVSIMGPRQSGKTTLVRASFPKKPYVNLEQPDTRLLAQTDPKSLLDNYPDGALFDEIQHVPELLSYMQVIVDEKKTNGLFIITGSHQIKLHQTLSQSLAGRVALLTLLPMTQDELKRANFSLDLDKQIYQGFFPRIYDQQLNPTQAYRNYVQTYLERDVRNISEIKDLMAFQTFMKLCAGRIGQILDYASLSNDVGVSSHTIKHWLSILEASYIIFRLPPYFENFGKRLIKSPKLYFVDTGLAAYLLDIENSRQVARDPLRGNLFENLVVSELVKQRYNRALGLNLYFYRDSRRNEVDLIIKEGATLIPVEIKSAKTFTTHFLKGIKFFSALAPERVPQGYVVYAGELEQKVAGHQLLNYQHLSQLISTMT